MLKNYTFSKKQAKFHFFLTTDNFVKSPKNQKKAYICITNYHPTKNTMTLSQCLTRLLSSFKDSRVKKTLFN
jgi:hypothetical protein